MLHRSLQYNEYVTIKTDDIMMVKINAIQCTIIDHQLQAAANDRYVTMSR